MKTKQNIAIFASYNGSSLDNLYSLCKDNKLSASIELIITNNTCANILNKAKKYNIDNYIINSNNTNNINKKILKLLKNYDIDYVLLMGYMKKVSSDITKQYKIINTHPALLPSYGGIGMFGRYVHDAVIKNKEQYSGVTVHYVNENYDEGEIIIQEKILLDTDETVNSLEIKIKNLEKLLIIKALKLCLK
jgi:phosphoribosylglycinamide formyltransferase-1